MPPGPFYKTLQIWPKLTKPLGSKGFLFDGLRTPTFQARSVERWRKALGVFGFNGQREKILFPLTTI